MADNDTATQYDWAAEDKKLQLADELNEIKKIAAVRESEEFRLKKLEDSKRAPDYVFKSPEAKAQIDNSIALSQRNLERRNNELAQAVAASEKTQQEVNYNLAKAAEARGGPPATQTVPPPGPQAIQQPNTTPPNAIQQAAQPPIATPANPSPAPVPAAQRGDSGGFVYDDNGELIPADSTQAEEIRAEQNRVQTDAPQPVFRSAVEEGGEGPAQRLPQSPPPEDFVYEEDGTLIPADSSRAEERRAEIAAEEARGRTDAPAPVAGSAIEEGGEAEAALAVQNAQPEPVPPNVSVIQDENGTWGVWNDDEGVFIVQGLSQQEAQLQADEIAAGFGVQERPFPPGAIATGPEPVPDNYTAISDPEGTPPNNWAVWNDTQGVYESRGLTEQEAKIRAENLSLGSDEPIPQGTPGGTGLTPEEQQAKDEAAAKEAAINQATRQSVYKQAGSSDWRVRLQLAPTSNYLYNANPPGILGPLAATNGVIFPYTPAINTSYKANYEQYDLVHSNYRGVYYKNSRVDDLNIRATFTAQDTTEADYLLAVIHFFRSVTKMFYGKDDQRGTPPPLVFLSGLGLNQFYGHPCVVSNFQYNLPDNVDYIRATSVNNYGTDLLSRRTPSASSSAAGLGATGNRILNSGLEKFFPSNKPAPDPVVGSVNNTQLANYVPTKMEIDITLIPVQTRSQVSKQFSLKGFANGDLIKGGFW